MITLLVILFTTVLAHQRILLRDVDVLTFQKGEFTTGRRSSPIPQLRCIAGAASNEAKLVETVQCRNTGFDGRDYNWECKSHLEPHLKLGKTQVSCEGYNYPDDPYILAGSCGLEYSLEYTNGKPPAPAPAPARPRPFQRPRQRITETRYVNQVPVNHNRNHNRHRNNNILYYYICYVLFIIAGIFFISKLCSSSSPRPRPNLRPSPRYTDPYPPPYVPPTDTTSSFASGVVVGSLLTQRSSQPTHTHTYTHTETIIPDPPVPVPDPVPTPTEKPKEETVSYATTKRR